MVGRIGPWYYDGRNGSFAGERSPKIDNSPSSHTGSAVPQLLPHKFAKRLVKRWSNDGQLTFPANIAKEQSQITFNN